jgi:uncharacterized protein YoxC
MPLDEYHPLKDNSDASGSFAIAILSLCFAAVGLLYWLFRRPSTLFWLTLASIFLIAVTAIYVERLRQKMEFVKWQLEDTRKQVDGKLDFLKDEVAELSGGLGDLDKAIFDLSLKVDGKLDFLKDEVAELSESLRDLDRAIFDVSLKIKS